ncbi:MAG: glycosyltransferase family 4 protein [Allosphingosinicella sp.]
MRLLFVIKTLSPQGGSGGAERVLTDVVSELAARGHDVTVLSYDPRDEPVFYPLPVSVRQRKIGVGKGSRRTTAGEMLARARRLRKEIADLAPDVVIGFMHSAYVPLVAAMARTGIPLVASEHIVFDHYDGRLLEKTLVCLAGLASTRMTIISDAVRDSFPGALQSKMTVIPNPVSVNPVARADPAGGGAQSKTILCVGRLEPQKDHGTLIEAFGRLAPDFPDWHLRIIGEGGERQRLEQRLDGLGLAGRVAIPGREPDIEREYAAAQIFVMPSLYESFGLATAEALAHGLPVIGFADCPGTNELVRDQVNGLLVAGEDRVAALAAALRELIESEALRVRLGDAAPATVERFSVTGIADRWETLLESLARARHGRDPALQD